MGAGGKDVYLLQSDSCGQLFWQRTIGEAGDDYASCIQKTSDGGYIIAGWTESSGQGGKDCLLIKADASGNLVWRKTYGGAGNDQASCVQQTSDGGYILAGWTTPAETGSASAYLFKTDASGVLVCERVYSLGIESWAYGVLERSDGGYLMVGCINYSAERGRDVYIVQTKPDGSPVAEITSGLDKDEGAYSIWQTSDGGFVLAGWTESYGSGGADFLLQKYDSSLNLKMMRYFGGVADDVAYSVLQTQDGGYILAGFSGSFGAGGEDVYLVKIDSTGENQWQKFFGGVGDDVACSIKQLSDGGYILAGWTTSFGAGGKDVYLVRTDAYGNPI